MKIYERTKKELLFDDKRKRELNIRGVEANNTMERSN